MAILGAESYSHYGTTVATIDSKPGRSTGSDTYQALNSTDTRFGTGYCYQINDWPGYIQYTVTTNDFFFGTACQIRRWGGTDYYWIGIFNDVGASQCSLTINSAGTISLRRGSNGGTVIATSTLTLSIDTWHWIEWDCIVASTGGKFILKIDGVEFINYSGDTANASNDTVGLVGLYAGNAAGAANDYTLWSDTVWQDSSGDFLGDSRVECDFAESPDTSDVDWLQSTGTDNYALIDEAAPSDTDYNYSATVTDKDLYNFTAISTDAVIIHGVQVSARAEKSDTGSRSIALRTKDDSTNEQASSNKALTTGFNYYSAIFETYNGTNAWTKTKVDGGQFGIELTV